MLQKFIVKYQTIITVILTVLFVIINLILIANVQFYWLLALPLLLVIISLYIFSLDKLLLLISALTPLSIKLSEFGYDIGVSIPAEPLLLGVLILFILRFFTYSIDLKLLKHPLTILIGLHILWIFLTSFVSEIPIVSFKFLISQLSYIIPFYFLGIILFKQIKNFYKFNWLYIISFVGVIFYTFYRHSTMGFSEETGHWVMSPFYNDHTAYGGMLVFFIPFIIKNVNSEKGFSKLASILLLVLFSIALVLSYSRAAWISLGAMLALFLILKFKISFKLLGLIGLFFALILWSSQSFIVEYLEKNRQDSSDHLVEHIESITNISSDVSNLERINRWQVAIRLFKERPIQGWGSGCYQFVYAPFQKASERTIISTNAGDHGGTHSEFLRPLAERGVIGFLLMLLIVIYMLYTGIKVYSQSEDQQIKSIALVATLSLFGFFIHGLLNEFLDSDKAAVPVWAYAALIISLDLYHKNKKSEA